MLKQLFQKPSEIPRKIYEWVAGLLKKLVSLKDTPHSIAGGIAIGMFMGFSPLIGLKTALAVGLAWVLRCNMVAAAVAVSLHDVFMPLWPFLLRLEYDIGYWLLNVPHRMPPKFDIKHSHLKHLTDIFEWTQYLKHEGRYLLVGSVFFSTPAAVISYYVSLFFLRRRKVPPSDLAD